MKFKTWLKRSYKKDDGDKLSHKSVHIYLKAYKEANKFIYRQDGKNFSEYSLTDAKKMLDRLEADKVFQEYKNAPAMYRALTLYIEFKEKNIE